ncbi:MAG: esterase family protein [Tannerellaceae bacterium]|nr:esterase family protein [Tannerellaceae bacterium]
MKRIFISLLIVCSISSASAQLDRARSKIKSKTIHSNVLNTGRNYNIYLPISYDLNPNKRYPILYLLHGLNGTNKDWFERGHLKDVADQLIAGGEACEMIIVSPDAGGNIPEEWNGYFNMPGWNYETFFFTEFVPHIESEYRVIGNKANRAIAGLSMGGGGSTQYAQRYSSMFSSVYAMSALMSIPEGNSTVTTNPNSKMEILNNSVIENSCIDFVKNASDTKKEELRSIVWYVDCGDDDFLIDRNIEFYQVMRAAQIPLQFRVRDGGHTWEYWHSALYTCLPFIARNFKNR